MLQAVVMNSSNGYLLGVLLLAYSVAITLVEGTSRQLPFSQTDDGFSSDHGWDTLNKDHFSRKLSQNCPDGLVLVKGACCPESRAGPNICCAANQAYTPYGQTEDGCCNAEFACGLTCCVTGECDPLTQRCCAKGGVIQTLLGGCCPQEQMCAEDSGEHFCCPSKMMCFQGVCQETTRFAWLAECSEQQLCGRAQNKVCCGDDEICWKSARCCKAKNRCGLNNCCTEDQTCCSSNACCSKDQVCINGACYQSGSFLCGGSYVCGPDQDCLGNRCCKRGSQLCGGQCCNLSTSTCLNGRCVAAGSTLCNGAICGPSQDCAGGTVCCEKGWIACGSRCCPGDHQCRNSMCIAPGQQMCSSGNICPSTSTCCGGSCCDSGSVCLNQQTCCPVGAVGCGSNCCNSGFYCSGNSVCCPWGQACSYWGGWGGGSNGGGIWNNVRWRR